MENEPNHVLPDGFYEFTWQWVDQFFQEARYDELHPMHQTSFPMPKCLKEDWVELFELHVGQVTTPSAYVTAIPGGRICGDGSRAAVISQDNKLIHDVSRSDEARPEQHWIFQQNELPEIKILPGNAAYIDTIPTWHHNYYHWMFDVAAKFGLLKRSGMEIHHYILNPRTHSFQFETFRHLDIPEDKVIENYPNLHIKPDQLILASQPTLVPEWACKFLRRTIIGENKIKRNPKYKKVYISRAKAAGRRVINEKVLVKALRKKGFAVVELDQLSVLEQAEIFASSEIIIAPHGAGLTNLVFAGRGTALIELFSPAYVHPLYWVLSSRAGVDYYYVIGEGPRLEPHLYKNWPESGGDDDIQVNVQKLLKVLRYAGY